MSTFVCQAGDQIKVRITLTAQEFTVFQAFIRASDALVQMSNAAGEIPDVAAETIRRVCSPIICA